MVAISVAEIAVVDGAVIPLDSGTALLLFACCRPPCDPCSEVVPVDEAPLLSSTFACTPYAVLSFCSIAGRCAAKARPSSRCSVEICAESTWRPSEVLIDMLPNSSDCIPSRISEWRKDWINCALFTAGTLPVSDTLPVPDTFQDVLVEL